MMLMVDVTMRSHEFSRTVQALDIGEDGLKLSLSAENDERDLLARRFGLIGIRRLAAEVCLLQRANDDERIYLDRLSFRGLCIKLCYQFASNRKTCGRSLFCRVRKYLCFNI